MKRVEKAPLIPYVLLRLLLRGEDFHEFSDDIDEIYQQMIDCGPKFRAKAWYWFRVIESIPSLIKHKIYWRLVMINNYFKLAIRNIKRHKGYSFINIAGLALGIACFILIMLYIQFELSYDKFHKNADNIYQVSVYLEKNTDRQFYIMPLPLASAIKDNFPEVIDSTRYESMGSFFLSYQNRKFYETSMLAADPSFFKMFSFPFSQGNPNSTLEDPFSIVISEAMAKKYFSNEDPIGKVLRMNNQYELTVTAVIKNVPDNSTLQFDFIVPLELKILIEERRYDHWGRFSTPTFIELRENVNIDALNIKIADMLNERLLKQGQLWDKNIVSVLPFVGRYFFFYSDKTYVYIFSLVAFFILIIACINYMNLTTARSANRAKEVGVRKITGAYRRNLIFQFLGESLLLSFTSVIFGILLVSLFLPVINSLVGKELVLNRPFILLVLVGLALFTGIAGGSYPALFLSAFQPDKVLKGHLNSNLRRKKFRRLLVVIQFSLSIILIAGTGVVHKQISFLKNKIIGYDKEHIIRISMRGESSKYYKVFKDELLQDERILGVTGSAQGLPFFYHREGGGVDWEGKDPNNKVGVCANVVDYDFTETLKIDIVEGRGFSRELSSDVGEACLVNEEMVKLMELESVDGASIRYYSEEIKIIGVMKNFHFKPLFNLIEPLFLRLDPERVRSVLIRIHPENISSSLAFIEKTWKRIIPMFPFEFNFLEEAVDRTYRNIERTGKLINNFTVLAVFIACLGLFGLASFMAEQRTKEIGVRKVIGASVSNIILLLMKEFIKYVLIANIVAWPIAYYFMNRWLENFPYRSKLGLDIFIFSVTLTFVLALLTVSYQSIKAAIANPVDSLRYE
ncbi:MAG: ABC transporter permease [Candidatus Aminicenantes bacterium]|nr:ABC transporter permease [Candidatus Aminicenantes bacterium]